MEWSTPYGTVDFGALRPRMSQAEAYFWGLDAARHGNACWPPYGDADLADAWLHGWRVGQAEREARRAACEHCDARRALIARVEARLAEPSS